MFAYVVDGVIEMMGQLPSSARRLDTQEWVMGLAAADVELQEACGWFVVVQVAPPTVTETQRAELSVVLVEGRPTEVWTIRAETAEEFTQRTRKANNIILRDPAANLTRLTTLREFLTDPDVATFVGRANNTPWDATDRRAVKTAFRTIDRLLKALEAEVRGSVGGELLDDISNT